MRLHVAILLLSFPCLAAGQEPQSKSYIDGFSQLLADKTKEMMPVGLFGLEVKPAAAGYLPVWKFHPADQPAAEFLNLGLALETSKELRGLEPAIGGMLNLVGLSARVWDFEWAKRHVTRSKFPAIFVGPSLLVPFDAKKVERAFTDWTGFKRRCRLMVGVRF